MLYLVPSNDFSLFEYLHGIQLSIVYLLDKHHFTVRSFANYRDSLEVFLAHAASFFLLILDAIRVLLFDFFFTFHISTFVLHGLALVWLLVNFHSVYLLFIN